MLKVIRETDVSVVARIKKYFILENNDDAHRDIAAAELGRYMELSSDRTCVIVGYDEDEVVGLIIAWIPANREYVWLDQSWYKQWYGEDIRLLGFNKLVNWALDRGIKEIRSETNRDSAAIKRRWGFEEHSVIIKRCIDDISG